ncbi:MAG: P-loop NTPase [Thermoplasmatota archaeon]
MDETRGAAMSSWDQAQLRIKENLGPIKNKITIMSGKGGVGKTTVAVNLSVSLSERGKKVGLLDVDLHGPNVPVMLGLEGLNPGMNNGRLAPIEVNPNLRVFSLSFLIQKRDAPVIWRGPMKINAINEFLGDIEWGVLDYLIIDLPPGTGDEALSIAQSIPGSGAIIVTTPQEVALLDSRRSVNFARSLEMDVIGIVENMSGFTCPHCGKGVDLFKSGGGEEAAAELSVPFLGRIPVDPGIVTGGDSGNPFAASDGGTISRNAFMKIVDIIDKKE